MCRSMADIRSTAAEIRRGKKKKKKKERKKLQGKNIMAPLLHRAAIIIIIIMYAFLFCHKAVISEALSNQTFTMG